MVYLKHKGDSFYSIFYNGSQKICGHLKAYRKAMALLADSKKYKLDIMVSRYVIYISEL